MTEFLKYSMSHYKGLFVDDDNKNEWISTDTKKLFDKNCRQHPKSMKYWIDNPFTYTINKYGFRCGSLDNISNNPKILTVGCSHTFGIGMPEHGIWTRLLSDKLNLELYNLGIPGGSADSVHRTIKIWFDKIRPDLIAWFFPRTTEPRYERFNDENLYKYGPNFGSNDKDMETWYTYKEYSDWMKDKNIEAIKYIIGETPIVIQRDWYRETLPQLSFARDLDHRGFEDHEILYNEILRKVENNEYT